MANIKEAFEYAAKNPNSEFARNLEQLAASGSLNVEAKKNGIDLSEFQKPVDTGQEQKIQTQGQQGQDFLNKSTTSQIFSAQTAKEVPGQIGSLAKNILYDTPKKIGKSLVDIPYQLATGKDLQGTYQSEAGQTANDIIDGKKPLYSALKPFATVPLDVTSTVGLGIGAKNAVVKSAPILAEQLAKKQAANVVEHSAQTEDLIGKIIQGKPEDILKAKKAFNDINLKNISSYEDLVSTLDQKIATSSKILDSKLASTPTYNTPLKLADLETSVKVGDKTVRHNYVDDAIEQLDNFYTKTNNVAGKAKIDDLKVSAEQNGMTVQQLNDLAKLHGQELNGFNANGELASGLSKQAAENTRSGLKTTAREIYGDKAYKEADIQISNLIKTKDLVNDVATKVNSLQQRVTQRGFGEKIGRLVFQVADKFTGGGLKGFVQSFIPRGQGLKVMNALDLESALKSNLGKLDKALQTDGEGAVEKILLDILKPQSSEPFLNSQPSTKINANTSKSVISPNTTTKATGKSSFIQRIKDTPNKQGGFAKIGSSTDIQNALEKYDPTPLKVNGKLNMTGNIDNDFRLSQLQDKLASDKITAKELKEAEKLLKEVGAIK